MALRERTTLGKRRINGALTMSGALLNDAMSLPLYRSIYFIRCNAAQFPPAGEGFGPVVCLVGWPPSGRPVMLPTMGPNRRAQERERAAARAAEEAKRAEADRKLARAAIAAGLPWLTFYCPACTVVGRLDLRTLDRHRGAAHEEVDPSVGGMIQQGWATAAGFQLVAKMQPIRPRPPSPRNVGLFVLGFDLMEMQQVGANRVSLLGY
jgi:hypothetical protein